MKKLICTCTLFIFITTFINAQLTVKDHESTPNTLLQVFDEGNFGSIFLPPSIAVLPDPSPSYKLYNNNGTLYWNNSALGTSTLAGGWTRITGKIYNATLTDKVGIGTNNPAATLDIRSSGTDNDAQIQIGNSNGTHVLTLFPGRENDPSPFLSWINTDPLRFVTFSDASYNDYNELMRIESNGNVGIGTTTPLAKLHVIGGNEDGGFFTTDRVEGSAISVQATESGGTGYSSLASSFGGHFKANGNTGVGAYGWSTGSAGTGVVGIGKAYNFDSRGTGIPYGTTSSIRWKRDIIEINEPLKKLAQLRGVYFNWDQEHGGHHDVGCIAEEVGKVFPEIVVYEENGIDADGMDYSKLTPLLIEVAKVQQKKIEELNKMNTELVKRLNKIEEMINSKRLTEVNK